MQTDELIDRLAADVRPVRPWGMTAALLIALACGVAAAGGLMLGWLGLRPDLSLAMKTGPFWMKFTYTMLLALIGFFLADRAGRAGSALWPAAWPLILAFVMIAALALIQTLRAPQSLWRSMLLGQSYTVCPWRIVVIAVPILIAMLLMLRRMAPTRPMLAGAAAGILAGSAGATVYGLHCQESAALFTAVWYTLGVAAAGAVGALAGRFALRW